MSEQLDNKTAKQKLDEILGIGSSETIDDFMKDLSTDTEKAKDTAEKIDEAVKAEANNIDKQLEKCLDKSVDFNEKDLSLKNIKNGLNNIDSLIETSKVIVTQIYQNIVQTDIIDSELVRSAAAFIEAEHLLIKEYIDLYKARLKFYEKIELENLTQKHRLELLQEKHRLEMEKILSQSVDATKPADNNMVSYNFDDLTQKIPDGESN
jgi:hypothetical protein